MTEQEADELLDDFAAEYPLEALRQGYARWLTDYRLDACAVAEPLAALVYAGDLLTEERHAWCLAESNSRGELERYVPDRLARERLVALRSVVDVLERMTPPEPAPQPEPEPRRRVRSGPRLRQVWTIPCEVCGTDFTARRADARFCGAQCRQKASRRRRTGSPGDDAARAGYL